MIEYFAIGQTCSVDDDFITYNNDNDDDQYHIT